ncbi:hypothetical protein E8K88_16225 [Lampropedia aestuarii]|uniref:Uncharacterized protein n=1 Tax=Lampropedia aestuarii TaxID=2562762 RepID=A0A4S5BGA4_9BURK|nr:hypothetical protein [Lampropedia aestuarii]THJ31079.1 hypothetical protein E8K88_16225 [Lampropedia aestuarii]
MAGNGNSAAAMTGVLSNGSSANIYVLGSDLVRVDFADVGPVDYTLEGYESLRSFHPGLPEVEPIEWAEQTQASIQPNGYPQPGPNANTTGLITPKTQAAAPGASSNPSGGAETAAEQGWWGSWGSGVLHGVLDVAGLVPGFGEVADLANAAVYAAEGDYTNAAISAAAAIPFAGWAATGAKAAKRVGDAVDTTRTATTAAEAAVKGGREAADTAAGAAAKKADDVPAGNAGGRVDGKRKSDDGKADGPCAC